MSKEIEWMKEAHESILVTNNSLTYFGGYVDGRRSAQEEIDQLRERADKAEDLRQTEKALKESGRQAYQTTLKEREEWKNMAGYWELVATDNSKGYLELEAKLEKAEAQLALEQKSVNELSLALQKAEAERESYKYKWARCVEESAEVIDGLMARMKELESSSLPSRLLRFCKTHKTICMIFDGELACCLQARIRVLEEGIRAEIQILEASDILYNEDEMVGRLKKLIEE